MTRLKFAEWLGCRVVGFVIKRIGSIEESSQSGCPRSLYRRVRHRWSRHEGEIPQVPQSRRPYLKSFLASSNRRIAMVSSRTSCVCRWR
jgi:hypothetical protein